jgi:hypothetical protein
VLCLAVLVACAAARAGEAAGTAVVSLPESATTSAGIFDSGDRLVRTLWSAQRRERGAVPIDWDGRDDEGRDVAADGGYVVRVLAHAVQYRWQGVIGNTSQDSSGAHVFRAFLPIHDMAFDRAGDGFYVVGYNERQAGMHRFRPSEPRRQDALAHDDFRRVFRYVATDGNLAFFENTGLATTHPGDMQAETFVVALNAADGTEYVFPVGRHAGSPPESVWQSVIDYDDGVKDPQLRLAPSGLAVQQRGNVLFVAHAGAGEIRLFDKRSGARTGRIEFEGAGDMAVAPDDSLWVLGRTGSAVTVRHLRELDGYWLPAGEIGNGLIDPVAIAVSPVDGSVVVADAGTEQLKAFDAAGRALWVLGRSGGYRQGGPEVTDDRFGFGDGPAYVAFQADGSFWVGDPRNDRNLHFSAGRKYLGRIMYLPHTRVTSVDTQDPRRVFSGFLEFEVDYSKPLASSWRLVRNWSAGLDQRYRSSDFAGLQAVYTLPGGHTLGVARRFDLDRNEIMELDQSGLRSVGATLDADTKLYPDGSLRQHLIRGGKLQVYSHAFKGFDAAGNPQWGPPALLATVPALLPNDPYYHDVPQIGGINDATYPQTSRGIIVSFNPGKAVGFHLGGIDPHRDGWLWRASPSGSWDVDSSGNITPRDGRYEIDHGVNYPGNVVTVAGRQVVYGYHGEGWRNGEADQWLHFYDNGLFVGQFGTPGLPVPIAKRAESVAGFAGNAFTPQLVTVAGQVYLWHNDESGHGGVHRWWLKGADDIRLLEAPIR